MAIALSAPGEKNLAGLLPSSEAPDETTGGFLVGENGAPVADFVSPRIVGHTEYELPDLPETPIDEATGLPYCFAPNPRIQELLTRGIGRASQRIERQHQYPRVEVLYGANPILTDEIKPVLLNLRWQLVTYEDHHYGYNPNYIGPKQPATHTQLGVTAVMGLAGYIPEMALDFSGSEPAERSLSPQERRFLWRSGQVHVGSEGEIAKYLLKYVFQQDTDHIREQEIDEFLHTFNRQRKLYLGHCLAAKIVERAVEPIEPIYNEARRHNLLSVAARGNTHKPAPTNPRDLVKAELTSGKRFGRVFNELHIKLGSANRPRVLRPAA